jgi:hypothetical protein
MTSYLIHPRIRLLWVATLVGALSACGGGSSTSPPPPAPAPAPPPSIERDIAPATTDAAIDQALDVHVAINPSPSVAPVARLYLHLPGTGGIADNSRLILRAAAARGLHAVGLSYSNEPTVGSLCNGSTDPNCHGNARRERILGEDTSTLVSVTPANAVVNRIYKLLVSLNNQYPTEGWGQYLDASGPRWSFIHIGGHSQGAGHAGYMTKLYNLGRACYFSSPTDNVGSPTNALAAWSQLPNITPAERMFGFIHTQDSLASPQITQAFWQALGMGSFGAAVSVDGASTALEPPFNASHMLLTSAAPDPAGGQVALGTHSATVVDRHTPKSASGTPGFEPVWDWMCFRPQ